MTMRQCLYSVFVFAAPLVGQVSPQRLAPPAAEASAACEVSVQDAAPLDSGVVFAGNLPAETRATPVAGRRPAASQRQPAAVFDWDFGDSSPHSAQRTIRHSYSRPGLYIWSLAIQQGVRRCSKNWVIAVPRPAPYDLRKLAESNTRALVTALQRDYAAEAIGTNLKGTASFPLVLRLEGAPVGAASCQARNAEFVTGDESAIDQESGPAKPGSPAAIPAAKLGLRLRTGYFTCANAETAPQTSASRALSFPLAQVEYDGTPRFAAGSRMSVGSLEYQYDGESWQNLGPSWTEITETLQTRLKPELLAELARKHTHSLVRIAAISAMTSQTDLGAIALGGERGADRLAAIQRLTSPGPLRQVVASNQDLRTRLTAVQRISDTTILDAIVRADYDQRIRLTALRGIADWVTLAGILRDLPAASPVRAAALMRLDESAVGTISEPSVLRLLAIESPRVGVRQTAIARVDDNETLRRAAMDDMAHGVRLAAVNRLRDPPTLTSIALGHSDQTIALAATARMSDAAALSTVALNSRMSPVRQMAVAGIADETMLSDLAVKTSDVDVGKAAVRAIKQKALLELIAKSAVRAPVWLAAGEAAHLSPLSAARLGDTSITVVVVPFANGNSKLRTSVEMLEALLTKSLSASGWHLAEGRPILLAGAEYRVAALEAGRKTGATAVVMGNATGIAGKGGAGAVKSLTLALDVVDVLTGTTILAGELSLPMNRGAIREKEAQSRAKAFAKRLNEDIRKGGQSRKPSQTKRKAFQQEPSDSRLSTAAPLRKAKGLAKAFAAHP